MTDQQAFWSRVFTYIPTPTTDDGETVDERRLRQVIDYQIEHRVQGICVLGSTAQCLMSVDQQRLNRLATERAAARSSTQCTYGSGQIFCY